MKEPWHVIVAVITLAVILVGWGISYGTVNMKARQGVMAHVACHRLEIDMACMKQSMSRIPVIESKLDELLAK